MSTYSVTFYGDSRIGRALRKLGVPYSFSRKAGGYVVSRGDCDPITFVHGAFGLHRRIMLNAGTTSVEMDYDDATREAYRTLLSTCSNAEALKDVDYQIFRA